MHKLCDDLRIHPKFLSEIHWLGQSTTFLSFNKAPLRRPPSILAEVSPWGNCDVIVIVSPKDFAGCYISRNAMATKRACLSKWSKGNPKLLMEVSVALNSCSTTLWPVSKHHAAGEIEGIRCQAGGMWVFPDISFELLGWYDSMEMLAAQKPVWNRYQNHQILWTFPCFITSSFKVWAQAASILFSVSKSIDPKYQSKRWVSIRISCTTVC